MTNFGSVRSFALPGVILLLGLALSSCDHLIDAGDRSLSGPPTSAVYWITASEDTYASCDRDAACREGDRNFGQDGFLVVAAGPLEHKRSYVDFVLPDFPEGTGIEYAKLELYHPESNADGAGDNVNLAVGAMFGDDWNESTLTWNMRPDLGAPSTSGTMALDIRPMAWSGTSDIHGVIQRAIEDPAEFSGFVISASSGFFARQIRKGFYSANYTMRARDNVDRAPRLLLKVKLPGGVDPQNINLVPSGPNDTFSAPIRTQFVRGADFPAEWDVSPN